MAVVQPCDSARSECFQFRSRKDYSVEDTKDRQKVHRFVELHNRGRITAMGCRVDAQDANSVRQETPTFVGRLFGFLERLGGATGRFIATQYRRPGSINKSPKHKRVCFPAFSEYTRNTVAFGLPLNNLCQFKQDPIALRALYWDLTNAAWPWFFRAARQQTAASAEAAQYSINAAKRTANRIPLLYFRR